MSVAVAVIALSCACNSSRPTAPTPLVTGSAAPAITAQPASEGLTMGQGASLFVVASSPTAMTYQWYVGQSGDRSIPIAGATEWIYNTPNLLVSASYWVRVANATGAANSATAVISVRNATTPTGDPLEDEVLVLINQQRTVGATCGTTGFPAAPALAFDASLQMAARLHSQDMALNNFFSHTSLDGRTFTQRIRNAGYTGSSIGENIAAGYSTAQTAFDGWMASSGHCANIMSSAFQWIGIGYAAQASGSSGPYWTADFGGG